MADHNSGRVSQIGCLLCLALTISGCGDSLATLNKLAASGSIQQDAPVSTELETSIAAPPARVWALLVDAPSWPMWATQIDSVSAPGPLSTGTVFIRKTGGSTIHSQVQLFDKERRLGWTGTALTAKAVHIWTLTSEPHGGTTVTVKESMDGPLMKMIYPSVMLSEADSRWLAALKQAAESKP